MSLIKNQSKSPARYIIYPLLALLICACSGTRQDYETPVVSVRYFRALPADGITPRFEIGLHIINPNNFDLNIRGISYTVYIEEQRILLGVARDLPDINAYGEGDIDLKATTDMLNSIRLITGLINERRDGIRYRLDAKLDMEGFRRKLDVIREGEFSFRNVKE